MAFWEEAALPSSVRGPVECWALAMLAASWAGEDMVACFLFVFRCVSSERCRGRVSPQRFGRFPRRPWTVLAIRSYGACQGFLGFKSEGLLKIEEIQAKDCCHRLAKPPAKLRRALRKPHREVIFWRLACSGRVTNHRHRQVFPPWMCFCAWLATCESCIAFAPVSALR